MKTDRCHWQVGDEEYRWGAQTAAGIAVNCDEKRGVTHANDEPNDNVDDNQTQK